MLRRRNLALILGGAAACLLIILVTLIPGILIPSSAAAGLAQQPTPLPTQLSISNETCLSCHSQQNLSMTLENGELYGLFVPAEVYDKSVHGQAGYACVQCHTTVGNFPHPPYSAQDARQVTLDLNGVCQRCHSSFFELTRDSVHAAALEAGNREAAVCIDCHTSHAVRKLTDPETGELTTDARRWVPQTCANCHYAIYQIYSTSVHGSALLDEANPDVPTCIDCHGVHNIEDPTTAAFRLRSPDICAECHTDPELMDKYGLSTQVLDTYVADFHGTTVTIFEKQHPDQETNKPVCYDCHGVHDIKRVDDPVKGISIKENLLTRCQVCHPDATANFPDSWLSHYIPSPERYPLVFTVDLFYAIFIPTILGGMAVLVVLDVATWVRKRAQTVGGEPKRWTVGVYPHPEKKKVKAKVSDEDKKDEEKSKAEEPRVSGEEQTPQENIPEDIAARQESDEDEDQPSSAQESS